MKPTLSCDRDADIWTVTLDRPEYGNALSAELVRALNQVLAAAEEDRPKLLVFRGNGRNFCTGFDISNLEAETDDTLLARFVRIELLLQRIARAPILTAAVGHGRVMGAGADIFAACDIRIADSNSSFAFPGAKAFSIILGTRRLAQRVGTETALQWVESGRSIPANDALRTGLASHLTGSDSEIDEVLESQVRNDPWMSGALRKAASQSNEEADSRDLAWLVKSVERPGLHERLTLHAAQVKANKRS